MKSALGLVAILVVVGILSIWHYDGGTTTGVYVQAEIISHTNRASGKSSPDPAFYATLPSGVGVFVRDWGELPATFKGKVVLEKQAGAVSGKPIYKINVARTSALHNK
jgi:hypothetical protein